MQVKYPSSMIHRSKIPPPESVRHGDEPVIWVTSLAPEPDMSLPVFHERVSESVQSYHRHNGVKRFSSIRPYARERGEVDTVLTWTEKTIVTSELDAYESGRSRC
jgi:dedicator of cytokinesis protein 3